MSNSDYNPVSPEELEEEAQKNIKEFDSLLDSLSTLDDKRKALWRTIYKNAVTDRRNTYIMFSNLYQAVHGQTDLHAIHGLTLSKYLERLNKSNDQLIKLASLVNAAAESEEEGSIDEDDMYEKLGNINRSKHERRG